MQWARPKRRSHPRRRQRLKRQKQGSDFGSSTRKARRPAFTCNRESKSEIRKLSSGRDLDSVLDGVYCCAIMSLFGKLFGDGSPPEIPADSETGESNRHPPLPSGVDQFLPAGGQPAFRASVNAVGQNPQTGAKIFRAGAGSSLISQTDAEEKAAEAAQRNLRAATGLGGGRDAYAYAVDRRLEPVIESLELAGVPAAK